METITEAMLKEMQAAYEANMVQKVARQALFNNPIELCASVQEEMMKNQDQFSIDIKTMKAANQLTSGRCWIFAGLNILREDIAKRLGIPEFELSQNYLAFYDKLEKIHSFIKLAIEMKDHDWNDRTFAWLMKTGVQDGGQWDMFVNLVKKYGIVPKDNMSETYHSSNTATMNVLINTRLRKFAQEVRNLSALHKMDEIVSLAKTVQTQLYGFLCTCFGVPPTTFSFVYKDKGGDVHHCGEMSAKQFYQGYVSLNLNNYVSLIHAPTKDKPFYERFRVKYLEHADGDSVTYLNVELEAFKAAIIKQLKDGKLVWFGSDCSKFNDKKGGFWDDKAFDYNNLFEIDFHIDKETALDMRDSAMNHAMVFSGVDIVHNVPIKWKIENSWGSDTGHKGYFIASDSWFDHFVYQAVIDRQYLDRALLDALSKPPKELEPWDPMGTLAQ